MMKLHLDQTSSIPFFRVSVWVAFITLVVIAAATGHMVEASDSKAAIFEEDFDGMDEGQSPPGWHVTSDGGAVTVETVHDGNLALRLEDESSGSLVDAIKFLPTAVEDELNVEFDIRPAQTDGLAVFNLRGSNDQNAISVIFRPTGKVTVYDGSTERTALESYQADRWYTIKVSANVATQTFDVSIDGEQVLGDMEFRNHAHSVSSIRFNTTGASQGVFYFDRVKMNHSEVSMVNAIEEDFDGMDEGQSPPGWHVTSDGGAVTVETVHDGNLALKLEDQSSGSLVDAIKPLPTAVEGKLDVEFDVRPAQTDGLAVFNLRGSDDQNAISVIFRPTGKVTVYDGSTERTALESYQADRWYTVKVSANVATQTFDVSIDGERVLRDMDFRNHAHSASSIRFNTTGASQGIFHVDNVTVTHPLLPPKDFDFAQMNLFPHERNTQILFDADSAAEKPYLAFPTLLKLSEDRVIISYKRGIGHALDANGADLETIVFNPQTNQVVSRSMNHSDPTIVNQNPDLVLMPNGDIYNFVDWQSVGTKTRMGVRTFKSTDDGATFTDEGYFPQVGDYQYGYVFDYYNDEGTTYLLAMSFPELGGPRAVHALKSDDNGTSWSYVKNLDQAFDYDFNESSITMYDDHFLIAARGDDRTVKLFKTDKNFNMIAEKDLTSEYETVSTYIGRPSLFKENGRYYLLGRDISGSHFRLKLYHVDPDSLALKGSVWLADNRFDSYYAEHYMTNENGEPTFNVVTYERLAGDGPDIVRYEYDWREIESSRVETVVFESNFDHDTAGSVPPHWTTDESGGSVTVESVLNTDTKALRLMDSSSNAGVVAEHAFIPSGNRIAAAFNVLPEQLDAEFAVELTDGSGNQGVTLMFREDGQLAVNDGGSELVVGTYSGAVWQSIMLYTDVLNQTYDLYVNGEQVASELSFQQSVASISSIRFTTGAYTTGAVNVTGIKMMQMVHTGDTGKVLANGHIHTEGIPAFGERANKIHVQSNGEVEQGEYNGHLRIHGTPHGLSLTVDMKQIDWFNLSPDIAAIQAQAADDRGEKYTLRLGLDSVSSTMSMIIWQGKDRIVEAINQPFQGNIDIRHS